MLLHPDRYSRTGVIARKQLYVVHDSEGSDGSFTTLLSLLQRPGDRPLTPTRNYGSGYHDITNGLGRYVEMADATCGPYAAPPVNKCAWHGCMSGKASQTRDEWLDDMSRQHIRGLAHSIVDRCTVDGIPMVKTHSTMLQMRWIPSTQSFVHPMGYCSHGDISRAFARTDHTDPGTNFPWDVLQSEINQIAVPKGTEMQYLIRPANDAAVFITDGIDAVWAISQAHINARVASGMLVDGTVRIIDPIILKTLTLVGQAPNYQGVTDPHRIVPTDFAAWVKPQ